MGSRNDVIFRMRMLILLNVAISIFNGVSGTKLNVPRVLLPYSDTPPTFNLRSEAGCYSWTSTRPDLVNVQVDESQACRSSADIQARITNGGKSSAMIMAEDKSSGLLLRADIIVDKIHSLKIVTKTHELYLEETPEKFEVRAYDEHGNEFSTLKGIKFRWSIESGGGTARGADILRFMTWKDSPYNTEPILEKLESEGYQGNKVLLEGIKTGSAKVSVRLVDSQHSSVPAATEPLMVVANLFLVPPAANLLPCATLHYAANQFKSNKLVPVKLPSPNHNLVVDPKLAKLDGAVATVTAGKTPAAGIVELVDKNVAPGEMVKTPTADLNVVLPTSLELKCLPHKSWTTVVGREVSVAVSVVDKDNNLVYSSDNLHITLEVDNSYFQVKSSLTNGTLHIGVPVKPGSVRFTATLSGAGSCNLDSPITASAVMEIVPEMTLTPELTLLAWDPTGVTKYSVQHQVAGGPEGARLTWTSSNTSVASTNQAGLSSVAGGLLGHSLVSAHLTRHSHCDAIAKIEVVPATTLNLVPKQQEFELGSDLELPVQMTSALGSLTHCNYLPLKPQQSDPSFSAGLTPSTADHCASVRVTSTKVTHSKLSVSWSYVTDSGDVVTLSDYKYVASYSPLVPVRPNSGDTVLALDSERDIAWSGGPLAWPLQPSGHFSTVSIDDQTLLTSTRVGDPSLYVWRVKCVNVGDTKITLTVGNHPSSTLPNPVQVSSSISIHCAKPHSIQLTPEIPGPTLPNLPPCPLQARQGRQAAQSYLDLKLLVTIKDATERVIDSVSGVPVEWKLSDQNLGGVTLADGVMQSGEEPAYQILKVKDKTGPLDVTASISRDGGLLGSSSASDTAKIKLVDDAVVMPDTLDMFVLESASGQSSQGSGYFTVLQDDNSKQIVSSSYSASNSSVRISPVTTGAATLSLVDLCLSSRKQAIMNIKVAGVHKVFLETRNKVQQGDSITATVKMVDSNMRSLPLSSLQHVQLNIVSDQNHVSVAKGGKADEFILTGDSLGQAVLTASASYSGKVISSAPSTVTVYPPLVLDPRNISLIIGASFQFTYTGGPADCSVQFSIADVGLARTSVDGIVTSVALGTTQLTAKSVDSDGTVYGEDIVKIFIRPLSSLQLIAPSSNVAINTLLPLYLYGQDNDMNVYSYGSALPILNIDWSVTPQSTSISSPLDPIGHSLISDNNGVVVFSSKIPGKFTIKATVSISSTIEEHNQFQLERDRTLTVSTTINVEEILAITNIEQEAKSGELLLAPGTSYQLKSNKNSVFSVHDNSIVSVTKSGLVKAGNKYGSTVILAKHNQEEVAVVVDVKPVHYILVRAGPLGDSWHGEALENVPRGGKMELLVSRHDKWGKMFSHSSSESGLDYRPSRFDLVKMSGLSADSVGRGWTVLRVWDNVAQQVGWMVTKVGEGLVGVSSLQVGDVADFDSLVTGEGHWESDPPGILKVDPMSGVVIGAKPGHTRLRFVTQKGESVFVRQLSVTQSDSVSIDTSVVIGGSMETVTVPVVIGSGSKNLVSSGATNVSVSRNHGLFKCDISWDQENNIATVIRAEPQWTGSSWACVLTLVSAAPSHPAQVKLSVLGHVETLRYLPAFSVPQTSVELGVDGGVIGVTGHSSVLDMLETRHSEGLELGSPWLEAEGELHIPVYLSLSHYTSSPSVSVSVPATGQSVSVSIIPLVSSCKTNTGFISAMFGELLAYYQTVICIIIVSVITAYVTKSQFSKTQGSSKLAPVPAPAPAAQATSPNKQDGDTSQNAASPYLWTVDNSPIYGSPIYRRSPPTQPRNLAQYSYN